ncbi:MAG: DUF1570 domain-containing protein [Halieaceae bacterium]
MSQNSPVFLTALLLLLLLVPAPVPAEALADAEVVHRFGYRAVEVDDVGSFPTDIERAAESMLTVWQQWIGTHRIRPVQVELVLLGTPAAFEEMKQQLAPELPLVNGFYATATHQAVVQYESRQPALNRSTAIHEVAHLITSSQVGPVDRWLSEGISEYFETLRTESDGIRISPNLRYEDELQPRNLVTFLALTDKDWQSDGSPEHYATAWSLVYFLMDSRRGRVALREVLVRMTGPLRSSLSIPEFLDLSYPGGLAALERNWHQWLVAGEFVDHALY